MITRQFLTTLIAVLLLTPTLAIAQIEKPGEARSNMNYEEQAEWKEQETVLPAYPKPDDLLALESSLFDGRYEYLIDTASIVVGEDGITRYSVVIRKPGGKRQHVIHEGLYCDADASRIYGMASGGALREQKSDWQALPKSGAYVYRRELHESYLCSQEGGPLKAEDVQARLRGDEHAGLLGRHNSYYTGRN